jgi:hypothetical protein
MASSFLNAAGTMGGVTISGQVEAGRRWMPCPYRLKTVSQLLVLPEGF